MAFVTLHNQRQRDKTVTALRKKEEKENPSPGPLVSLLHSSSSLFSARRAAARFATLPASILVPRVDDP